MFWHLLWECIIFASSFLHRLSGTCSKIWDSYWLCHAAPTSCFKTTQKMDLVLYCSVLQRQNKKVAASQECLCGCVYVSACKFLCNFLKKYMQFHGQESQSQTETVILSCWVAILHVVMRLIGPSPICSGSLPSPRLLKLTIILPNLACVTAEDKCAMPSPPAARETLSHFKCQSMLFNTPKRFNIDYIQNMCVLSDYEGRQIQKKTFFNLSVYRTN